MVTDEDIPVLARSFAEAGRLDGSAEGVVTRAYEELLGYDVATMDAAEARIGYWTERLATDLTRDDFIASFLQQAAADRGNHVDEADFEGNQRAVEALADLAASVSGGHSEAIVIDLATLTAAATAARAQDDDDDDFLPSALGAEILEVRAGEVGDGITVTGEIMHNGGGEAQLLLEQGDATVADNSILLGDEAGAESVTVTASGLNVAAGAVTARLVVTEGGIERDDAIDVAVFRDQAFARDLQFEWADPAAAPYSGIGQVAAEQGRTFFGGEELGSGFLVSPEHVVTNAHVVSEGAFSGDLGSLERVTFELDAGSPSESAGAPLAVREVYTRTADFDPSWPNNDLAVLRLEEPVEGIEPALAFDAAWSAAAEPALEHGGAAVEWAGYPVNEMEQGALNFQWRNEGTVTGATFDDGGLEMSNDLYGSAGASGSPVYRSDGDGFELVGVYAGLLEHSPVAAPIDNDAHDWVLTLLQADGYAEDVAFAEGPIPEAELGPFADLGGPVFASDDGLAA